MQNQTEDIILLPTNDGKKRRNETEVFLRSHNTSNDYPADVRQKNLFKR